MESPMATPHPPNSTEAKFYYYGLPSQPLLVARSSSDLWISPMIMGAEAYFCSCAKEARPIGFHALQDNWEDTVGPVMVAYLESKDVRFTSLDPVRMGYATDSSPPVIIWIGVIPGSLSAENGIEVAVHCKGILSSYHINNVDVEIRESEVFYSAKMYKPAPTSDVTARALEPFSTALGLSICAADTPSIQGTGGFYISDSRDPDKLYLVTARHVFFHSYEAQINELYRYGNSSQPRKEVLLFGDAAIEKYIGAIKSEIEGKQLIIKHFEARPEEMDEVNAEAKKATKVLEQLLKDISRDWKKRENRVLGHVILSPPIGHNVGEEGFTEDWAVVEINHSKIDSTNFIGNAIDLGTNIPASRFMDWMYPHIANPHSFEYPSDRLLRFRGIISDNDMQNPSENNLDHNGNPCIMVIKRGDASGLTVGRLNTIRSFTRFYTGIPSAAATSKEITILSRDSKSGPFSQPGDSGAVVIDGMGRIVGLLTGGAGSTDSTDCTYVTSINFLQKRMKLHGINANLFPRLTV